MIRTILLILVLICSSFFIPIHADESPRQQVLSGTILDEVNCDKDLIIIEKRSDHSTACVTPSTAESLVSRNWGQYIYHYDSFQVPTENGTQPVDYRIKNGLVDHITLHGATKSIVIMINSTEDGKIIIKLPRTVMDERTGADGKSGDDAEFVILVDDEEADYTEKSNEFFRELTIQFPTNSKQIEIIGTHPA